ncbi:hypothetical protein I312_106499 [Cryptococcus bacillisporus CA1280]
MTCSGNPSNCDFCGKTQVDCAKSEVHGCTTEPSNCSVCEGKGCVALECTGNTNTCPSCKGTFTSCRKAQFSDAAEGIEPARRPAPTA